MNKGDVRKIRKMYWPPIQAMLERIERLDGVMAVYVRGSVSTGEAKPPLSDIDMVVVTAGDVPDTRNAVMVRQAARVLRQYPFVPFYDLTILSLRRLRTRQYALLRVNLKTHAALVRGRDVLRKERLVVGPALARTLYRGYIEDLRSLERFFAAPGAQRSYLFKRRPLKFWCVWAMRCLLRSSICFGMREYTPDLQVCHRRFVSQHPEWAPVMNKALRWATHPTSDRKKLHAFLHETLPAYEALWRREMAKFNKSSAKG